jgi:hypothetical protein
MQNTLFQGGGFGNGRRVHGRVAERREGDARTKYPTGLQQICDKIHSTLDCSIYKMLGAWDTWTGEWDCYDDAWWVRYGPINA